MAPGITLIATHLILAALVCHLVSRGGQDREDAAALRAKLAIGLLAWLAAALAIARLPLFLDPAASRPPAFAPVLFVVPLLVAQLIVAARWQRLRAALERVPPAALLAPQILRAASPPCCSGRSRAIIPS